MLDLHRPQILTRDPRGLEDSSDDQLSDDDPADGTSNPRPASVRMRRGLRPAGYWDNRKIQHQNRINQYVTSGLATAHANVRDWILLEFMENGSLASLIDRRYNGIAAHGSDQPPNRVLWAFWLCRKSLIAMSRFMSSFSAQAQLTHVNAVVRAVIGLEYPPNKFHADRTKPPDRDTGPPTPAGTRASRRLAGLPPVAAGQVLTEAARRKHMIRSIKGLGLSEWSQDDYDRAMFSK